MLVSDMQRSEQIFLGANQYKHLRTAQAVYIRYAKECTIEKEMITYLQRFYQRFHALEYFAVLSARCLFHFYNLYDSVTSLTYKLV